MKFLSLLTPVACFLILCSSLIAEWEDWGPLPGTPSSPGDGAYVEGRSRGGEITNEKGTYIEYEIRNQSTTHTANVKISIPLRDPKTGVWTKEGDTPPRGYMLSPRDPKNEYGATVPDAGYSPQPNVLPYSVTVEWTEHKTDKEKSVGDKTGTEVEADKTENSNGAGIESIPLDDTQHIIDALNADPDSYFDAVIAYKNEDNTSWPTFADYAQRWKEVCAEAQSVLGWKESVFEVREPEVFIKLENHSGGKLVDFLHGLTGTGTGRVISIKKVGSSATKAEGPSTAGRPNGGSMGPGNGDLGPEKLIIVSKEGSGPKSAEDKAAHSGGFGSNHPTKHHEGYWFDPGDKDAHTDETDPIIYVRYQGQAVRLRLSEAKAKYGVPQSATPDTMTHYSESDGMVVEEKDRGTHRK